ncbi:MAG: hypothetical protein JSU82_03995 [Rhodospirillales bacterium]|nr:MAG: hypothetical protein JSU82_03995 [Rhodospirillales bacterium]
MRQRRLCPHPEEAARAAVSKGVVARCGSARSGAGRTLSWLAFAALATLVPVPPADAAAAGLQDCAAIGTPVERLSCYDRLAREAAPPREDYGGWTLDETPSRLDPERTDLVLWTRSVNALPGSAGGRMHAVLMLQCRLGEVAAMFDFGRFVGGGSARIEYRIGNGAVLAGDVAVAPDHRRFGVWERDRAIGFIKALYGQPQLRLRIAPPTGDTMIAAFDLAGLEAAIAPLRGACGWE